MSRKSPMSAEPTMVEDTPPVGANSSCTCSNFSGNPDGCCTGADRSCHSWFSHATCGGDTPYCCTSNFDSKCCAADACTGGCRNSLNGKCDCKAQPTYADVHYDESMALHLLALNAASQCANSDLTAWTCKACPARDKLDSIDIIEAEGHLAYVGYDAPHDRLAIIFRGSLSVQVCRAASRHLRLCFSPWPPPPTGCALVGRTGPTTLTLSRPVRTMRCAALAPAHPARPLTVPVSRLRQLNCTDCHVHKGFLVAFHELWPSVNASYQKLLAQYPGRRVMVTGHSLGAAMAVHAVIALSEASAALAWPMYTFGQPRVGDANFADWFDARFAAPSWFRLVHWNDAVVHLAPFSFGYKHMAREIWYNEPSDAAMVCDGSGEDADCSLSVAVALVFDDHCSYLGKRNCQCEPFDPPTQPTGTLPIEL